MATAFACMGEVNPDDFDNVNSSEELRKILQLENLDDICQRECYDLFGFQFSSTTALDSEILFQMLKRQIYALQAAAQTWTGQMICIYTGHNENSECSKIHQDIVEFMFFLKSQLQSFQLSPNYPLDREESLEVFRCLRALSLELKGVLLHSGRLSDIIEHVVVGGTSCNGTRSQPAAYHYYHALLDLWWSVALSFYILDRLNWPADGNTLSLCRAETLSQEPPFSQCAFLLLWDLVAMASRRFSKLSPSEYFKMSPFHCTCLRELWILLINLLNNGSGNNLRDFWSYLNNIFETILNSSSDKQCVNNSSLTSMPLVPATFACCDPDLFCLWTVVHVAPLFRYGGTFEPRCRLQSNYSPLLKIAKRIFSSASLKKKELQVLLQCCLKLTPVWEPSIDLLLLLTEFFLKHLNEDFHQPTYGLDNRCMINKSGMSWSNEIREILDPEITWKSNNSSFQLYLRLLARQMKLLDASKRSTAYKQIKGRILPKITAKSVQSLAELGLHHFLSLLLMLSCLADDASDNMSEKVYTVANMASKESSRSAVSWKAFFALMISMQDAGRDLGFLAGKAAKQFAELARCMTGPNTDISQRHSQMSLLLIFFEGITDVVGNSPNLALSEYLLFDDCMASLLWQLNTSELSAALSCIQHLLVQLRNFCQSQPSISALFLREPEIPKQHKSILSYVTKAILPFLSQHATTRTPPPQIADIAATLSLLSLERTYNCPNDSFSSLYQQFVVNPKVHPSVSCRYLSHVLPDSTVALDTKQKMAALRAWLRSCTCTLPPSDQVDELTRLVFKLSATCDRLGWLDPLSNTSGRHDRSAIQFFRLLGKAWKEADVKDKALLRQTASELFHDFAPLISEELKTTPHNTELTNHIFRLAGELLASASPAIYSMGKSDCPLPLILDSTVLPLTLIRDKPISSVVSSVCKQHLGLFVEGLSQLPYRSDAYIGRKLKDVICHYLPRFPLRTAAFLRISHPLLVSLMEQKTTDLLEFSLEVVRDYFIQRKGSNIPPCFSQALSFALEMVVCAEIDDDQRIRLASLLVPSILEHLLLSSDSGTMRACREALEKIFQLSTSSKAQPLLSAFQSLVENQLPWSSNRLFKLLEYVAAVAPDLTAALLPFLTKSVETVEEKRGLGRDQTLRDGIINVANKLHQQNN